MVNWDEKTDVVVIGSGLAGLAAAIEARQAGAEVLVLEKMKVIGGNTRLSDGGISAPGNYMQKKLGVEDSPELFFQDMMKAGLGLNHPHLVRLVAEKSGEAVDWTINTLGVEYLDRLDAFGGHSVARCLTTKSFSGKDLIKAERAMLDKLGVEIRTRCLLTRLLTDQGGEVTGVEIRAGYNFPDDNSGIIKNIKADRAVVLATGGFGNDIRFRMLQNPGLDESVQSTNHAGATAEGLIAALAIQAAPIHLSWIQIGPWGCPDEKGYGRAASLASYSVYPNGILVDPATGGRLVDEWADRRQRSEAIFKTGHACIGIVDARGVANMAKDLQRCLKLGSIKGFDTLADLATAYGMPSGELEKTVARYNGIIREGGRDEFGKPLGDGGQPLDTPPFYAVRLWPKVHYTPGGVGINAQAQVIDLHSRPIPRLFAAGEVCGGIHGASRLGSCALPECIVFGRIAGQQAAIVPPRS